MPIFETIDGEKLDPSTNVDFRADIVINPGGVMNRLNPSQLIETELNYISKIIRYRAEKFRTVNQKVKLFKEFLSFVSEEALNDYTELFDSLDNKELKEAVSEIIKHGFYIRQDTFWDNLNMFSLGKIYKHFDIKPEKVKGVENPLTIGEEYYIRLKHEPHEKLSARSVDSNNMMNLPTKTRDSKNSTAILNNNPLRLGEMELTNMGLVGSLDPVSRLLDMYANNEEARKELIKHQLLDDPFHINTDFEITTTDSNDKILKSYLNCLGVQIKANEDASEFDFIKSLPTEELDELVSLGKSDPDFNVLEYFKNKE